MLKDLINKKSNRKFCYTCFKPLKTCLCSNITPFDTETKFVILMHPKEARKEKTGTGRLAKAILKNSEIIVGTNFTENERVNLLIESEKFLPTLLYPGENTIDLVKDTSFFVPQNKKLLVFAIDGTWSCAKKIMKLSKNLHPLQRISFSKTPLSKFSIKTQPSKLCLSTIEALFYLIENLNKIKIERTTKQKNLLLVLETMVSFQKYCAEDFSLKGYRKFPLKSDFEKKSLFLKE